MPDGTGGSGPSGYLAGLAAALDAAKTAGLVGVAAAFVSWMAKKLLADKQTERKSLDSERKENMEGLRVDLSGARTEIARLTEAQRIELNERDADFAKLWLQYQELWADKEAGWGKARAEQDEARDFRHGWMNERHVFDSHCRTHKIPTLDWSKRPVKEVSELIVLVPKPPPGGTPPPPSHPRAS